MENRLIVMGTTRTSPHCPLRPYSPSAPPSLSPPSSSPSPFRVIQTLRPSTSYHPQMMIKYVTFAQRDDTNHTIHVCQGRERAVVCEGLRGEEQHARALEQQRLRRLGGGRAGFVAVRRLQHEHPLLIAAATASSTTAVATQQPEWCRHCDKGLGTPLCGCRRPKGAQSKWGAHFVQICLLTRQKTRSRSLSRKSSSTSRARRTR